MVNQDLKIEIKRDEIVGAPYIQKVMLRYRRKQSEDVHSVVMNPFLTFKLDTLFMEIRTAPKRNGNIMASIYSIETDQCLVAPVGDGRAYLALRGLVIESELLGSDVFGDAHVLFLDMKHCTRWVAMFKENRELQRAEDAAADQRILQKLRKDILGSSTRTMRWTALKLQKLILGVIRNVRESK